MPKESDEEDCNYHLALGKQVHEMFAKYETENLKPGWEPVTFKYDFETYKKQYSTSSALAKDLMYAFVEQFMTAPNSWMFDYPKDKDDDKDHVVGDPNFKMTTIVDERLMKSSYFKKIENKKKKFELE